MGKISHGHYLLKSQDLKKGAKTTMDLLGQLGFRAHRRGFTPEHFKVEGVRGNSFIATILQQIPFMSLLGFGSRVKAVVTGQKSLKDGDDSCHLFLRVMPLMEWSDREEVLFASQGLEEHFGDNLQARRVFRKVVEKFRMAGLI